MEIDWNTLDKKADILRKADYVEEVIAQCTPGNPLFLSDPIVKGGAEGAIVLKALAEHEESDKDALIPPMKWKILVMRDEWGNVPNPGDRVYKVNKINTHKKGTGKTVSARERNLAIMDGSYSKIFEQRTEYIVDEKGCIEAPFTDAGHFLWTRGVHPKSNRPITTYRATSSEPVLAPDGNMLHIHYWLYKEATPEVYEKLPIRKHSKEPKRGFSKEVNYAE